MALYSLEGEARCDRGLYWGHNAWHTQIRLDGTTASERSYNNHLIRKDPNPAPPIVKKPPPAPAPKTKGTRIIIRKKDMKPDLRAAGESLRAAVAPRIEKLKLAMNRKMPNMKAKPQNKMKQVPKTKTPKPKIIVKRKK